MKPKLPTPFTTLRNTLLRILSIVEMAVIMSIVTLFAWVIISPAAIGELAACWYDTFFSSFIENINGDYIK